MDMENVITRNLNNTLLSLQLLALSALGYFLVI